VAAALRTELLQPRDRREVTPRPGFGTLARMEKDALASPKPWTTVSDAYAQVIVPMFEKYAASLLELASIDPTMRVLDVACGPGTVTLLAAKSAGHVSAIDFSPGMLEQLRRRVRDGGVRNVDAELMDAQHLTFHDGSFDAVTCSFGLMFVPERARALEEMRRVLRPGGRVALATWSVIEKRPLMSLAMQAARDALGMPTPPRGPMQSIEACEEELRAAGFRDVSAREHDDSARFSNVEEYWRSMLSAGAPIAVMKEGMTPDAWASVERKILAELREKAGEGELDLAAQAIFTTAVR
jgi:ubiquinone/menaquinone biosynthesis C-methylase UbiE